MEKIKFNMPTPTYMITLIIALVVITLAVKYVPGGSKVKGWLGIA